MIPFNEKPTTTFYDFEDGLQSTRHPGGTNSISVYDDPVDRHAVYHPDGSTEIYTWDETRTTIQTMSADGTISIERIERDPNATQNGRLIRRIHGDPESPN